MRAHRSFFTFLLTLTAVVAFALASEARTNAGSGPERQWRTVDNASVNSSEVQTDGFGFDPALNRDGSVVSFAAYGFNLAPQDNDTEFLESEDAFVRDRQTGETEMLNLTASGQSLPNKTAGSSVLSADGRYAAFEATGVLLPESSEFYHAIYIRDRQTGDLQLVSKTPAGVAPNRSSFVSAISSDARWIVYSSYADDVIANDQPLCPDSFGPATCVDIFLYDRVSDTTVMVSRASNGTQANDESSGGDVSDDGRYTVFTSKAGNLDPNDDNQCSAQAFDHSCQDVYLNDRQTGDTVLISKAMDGTSGNGGSTSEAISADGRYIAFDSAASDLVPGDTNNTCDNDSDQVRDDNCNDVFWFDRVTGEMRRVSVSSSGEQANADGYGASISDDGRYVAFSSRATNLVPGDNNNSCDNDFDQVEDDNCADAFVHDTQTGITEIVSVNSAGDLGNGSSGAPVISGDGLTIAVQTGASNLVPNDNNGNPDIIIAVRTSPPPPPAFTVEMVSVTSQEAPSDGESHQPSISGDGRYVAFESEAQNLEPNDIDADNHPSDIFLRDRDTGTTTLISRDSNGSPGDKSSYEADISRDGGSVAFTTQDGDIAGVTIPPFFEHVVVRDLDTGQNDLISKSSSGVPAERGGQSPAISEDGRYVAFSSDSDDLDPRDTAECNSVSCYDIFRHDRQTGATVMVSVSSSGVPGNTHTQGPFDISDDGMRVVFHSGATNLVPGDTNNFCDNDFDDQKDDNCIDVFLHDFGTGQTTRVSLATSGAQGNGNSVDASISGDGRFVAFESYAANLAPDDDNTFCNEDFGPVPDDNCGDVFVRDLDTGQTTHVSRSLDGGTPNQFSGRPSIGADGRYIAYQSTATDIAEGYSECLLQPAGSNAGRCSDIYVFDRTTGETAIASSSVDGKRGNDFSSLPSISSDGAVVAFHSHATNLVANDTVTCPSFETPNCGDIFAAVRIPDGTPTPTPVLTPSATPTAVPGQEIWGDVDCDGEVSSRDNQSLQRFNLQQNALSQTEPCPDIGSSAQIAVPAGGTTRIWGDNDCDGEITTRDNQGTLREVLQQNALSQTEPCPDVGTIVAIGGGTAGPTGTATRTATATPTRTATPVVSPTPSPSATAVFYPNPTNVCPLSASSGFPATILDGDSENPREVTFNFTNGVIIGDIEICVDIDHTWLGDLFITLEHPSSQTIQLMVNPNNEAGQCGGANMRVLFDDEAANAVQTSCTNGTPGLNGSYRPSVPLDAFDGLSSLGTWTLRIYDVTTPHTGLARGAWMWINFD